MPATTHPPRSQNSSLSGRRVAAVIAAGLCVAGAVAIWGLIVGRFDSTSARVLGSALAAAFATLCGLAGSTLLSRNDVRRSVGFATIMVSGLALVLALTLMWVHGADSDTMFRALAVTATVMLAGAQASLLLQWLGAGEDHAVRALVTAAIASACGAAVLACGVVIFAHGRVAPGLWRLLGVMVLIAVLGALLAPLMRRIRSVREPSARSNSAPGNGVGNR